MGKPPSEVRVLVGYMPIASAPKCPYCGDLHYAVEDHAEPDTLVVRCWCGARAKVRRDDPDMLAHLKENGRG